VPAFAEKDEPMPEVTAADTLPSNCKYMEKRACRKVPTGFATLARGSDFSGE
jgi:hypothetical protein